MSIKIKAGRGAAADPMQFANFGNAMKQVRSARPGDVLVNGIDPNLVPKSRKYRAQRATKRNMRLFNKNSTLYGANTKTPYDTKNIITSQAEGWEMMVGTVEGLNESFRTMREYRHSIEIVICLSTFLRIRSYGIDLFPPSSKIVDPKSFMDSRHHLEEMSRRSAYVGHPIVTYRGRLAEKGNASEIRRILPRIPYSRDLTRKHEHLMNTDSLSLEGFVRKIKDLCDGTHADPEGNLYTRFGIPGPKTLIRLSLDTCKGMVFNRETLDRPQGEMLVIAWLRDIIEVTSGDKRMMVYDPRIKAYRRIQSTDEKPPEGGMDRFLTAARDNMEYVHPAMRQT